MSRSLRFFTLTMVAASLLLAGCASTSKSSEVRYATPLKKPKVEVDAQRMAMIEAEAMRRGVKVRWVNPPIRVVDKD